MAAKTSTKLAQAIAAGKPAREIIKLEARLARHLAQAGHTRAGIQAGLKGAGSTSTLKQVATNVVNLKAGTTNARALARYNNMLDAMAKAPGVSRRALETLFRVEYSAVRAGAKAGRIGKSIPIIRIAYPVYAVVTSDGHEIPINVPPPIVPDDAVPEGGVVPTPTPGPGYGRYKPCKGCLKKMCGGANVEQLQTLLNKHRPSPLQVDGKFGKRTHKAVVEFQKQNKITPANGQACEDTMAALTGAAAEAPTPTAAPTGSDLTDDEIWNKIEQQIKSKHSDDFSEARMTWLVATVNKVIANEISQGLLKRNDWPSISKRAENLTKSFVVRLSKPGQTLQEEKNMFNVLKERKQQKNNETFDKLIKGLF